MKTAAVEKRRHYYEYYDQSGGSFGLLEEIMTLCALISIAFEKVDCFWRVH